MGTLQKTAVAFGAAGALIIVAFGIYAAVRPSYVDEVAREAEAIVERDYRHPERHTLTRKVERRDEEPHFIEWARRYDGVDMSTQVISRRGPGGWETRWHRELAEPEPVRRKDLVPVTEAVTRAGLAEAYVRGEVGLRLLYRPRFTLPPGSTDGELVVESYQLVFELRLGHRTGYVDAYTGKLIKPVRSFEPT